MSAWSASSTRAARPGEQVTRWQRAQWRRNRNAVELEHRERTLITWGITYQSNILSIQA